MKKGRILEQVTIETIGHGGVGVVRTPEGKTILVKGALPNSVVDIKIVKKKRSYATAHIVHVHSVDEKRTDGEAPCPHYFSPHKTVETPLHEHGCGGCKWQIMSYDKQLLMKHDMVKQCFSDISNVDILPVLPAPQSFGYRNKIEFSFGKYLVRNTNDDPEDRSFSTEEHWQLGFHKQGEFSKVVDIEKCYLISPALHEVYVYMKKLLEKSGLPVHDAKTHKGILRHLVMREGVRTNNIMINLVYASKQVADSVALTKKWKALLSSFKKDVFLQERVTTFVLTENNGLADVVKGQDCVLDIVWGSGRIEEELHIIQGGQTSISRFTISPFSFFQTNTLGAELLFSTAIDMLGEVKGNVVDLYCGSGTIGISLLKAGVGKQVKGIEVVASAIQDAHENAKQNNVQDKASFYCGKAEKLLLPSDEHDIGVERFLLGDDLVIIDPPREGLHPKVIDFLIRLRKEQSFRLLYISCNPTTMARDITLLQAGGYTARSHVQPVDMFPQTHHVECVMVFS